MQSGSHNTHSRLAPSSASRWTTCTASVKFLKDNADKLPKDTGSEYANEGTQAHDYAEAILTGRLKLDEIPAEFQKAVSYYVEHCRSLITTDAEVFVEQQVPLFYQPGDTGTCDFCVVREGHITVTDLKFGAGVLVEAEENKQLAIYAFSFAKMLRDEGLWTPAADWIVEMQIVQPRHHADVPIRTWSMTLGELREFCRDIDTAAELIRNDQGLVFRPSDSACRWCSGKLLCPAMRQDLLDALPDFDDLTIPAPRSKVDAAPPVLEDDAVAKLVLLFENRKKLEKAIAYAEEYLYDLAQQGRPAPGTKLVQGRPGNRAWGDEEAADKLIRQKLNADERYVKKLVSPTVAAELLDIQNQSKKFQNLFDKLVTRSDGRPTLALTSDKRPAIGSMLDGLDAITDDDTNTDL